MAVTGSVIFPMGLTFNAVGRVFWTASRTALCVSTSTVSYSLRTANFASLNQSAVASTRSYATPRSLFFFVTKILQKIISIVFAKPVQ